MQLIIPLMISPLEGATLAGDGDSGIIRYNCVPGCRNGIDVGFAFDTFVEALTLVPSSQYSISFQIWILHSQVHLESVKTTEAAQGHKIRLRFLCQEVQTLYDCLCISYP